MSSINRPLAGPVLTFDLAAQTAEIRAEEAYRRSGKAGRTLAKHGRFRLTLTALTAGGEVGTHQADSPLTVQVLEGALRFRVGGAEHVLRAGEVLFFGPGDAEDIRAVEDSAFLLTLAASGDDFREG
jgi:quercetin dioxygenase-like cupin family protein